MTARNSSLQKSTTYVESTSINIHVQACSRAILIASLSFFNPDLPTVTKTAPIFASSSSSASISGLAVESFKKTIALD